MKSASFALATASPDGLERLGAATADRLNSLPTAATQQFFVIAPSAAILEQLTAEEICRCDESSVTFFPITPRADTGRTEMADDWGELPTAVAVRVSQPEAAAVVVIPRSALSAAEPNEAPFRDVACSVWDWLIRQADRGRSIQVGDSVPSPLETLALLSRPRLVPLPADASRRWLQAHLFEGDLVASPQSTADAVALRAGLLQIHDFLDASHRQSQSVEGRGLHAAGDYWHAIMHRREPDYGNSKYWFRRVGWHPAFDTLAERATNILEGCTDPESAAWQRRLVTPSGWDPFAFVDLCEACAADEDAPLSIAASEIQWQEMRLLLRHTCQDAQVDGSE